MRRRTEVSAVELRRRLSALLDTAWQEPLLVTRYHAPWVWVLSDATWQQHRQQLLARVEHHPLARVRRRVDEVLASEHALLQRLLRSRRLGKAPEKLIRALLLRVIYDFAGDGHLYEQIVYNRLFNWFVGMDLEQPQAWTAEDLAAGLRQLLQDEGAVELMDRLLRELPLEELALAPGLRIDQDWLQGWKSRCGL